MSLLKAEPGPVTSLEELLALAAAMEQEAATRYAEIAERMRQEGDPALAEVFQRLSADERGHLDGVMGWSRAMRGQAPDPARIRGTVPETFDDEGAATIHPRLLSAYRVLSMAVRNEERAFAFWSYVAAHAEMPEIRQGAETLAHEELGHVAILRRERRTAFHAERGRTKQGESGEGLAPLERRLAELLDHLAAGATPEARARLAGYAEGARRSAEDLERWPIGFDGPRSAGPIPDDPAALAELLADRYLEAGDTLRDADDLARVQVMAGRAIACLAWLRFDLPELQGR